MDQSFSLQDLYEDRLETQRISTRFLNRYDVELWAEFFETEDAFEYLLKRNGKNINIREVTENSKVFIKSKKSLLPLRKRTRIHA